MKIWENSIRTGSRKLCIFIPFICLFCTSLVNSYNLQSHKFSVGSWSFHTFIPSGSWDWLFAS